MRPKPERAVTKSRGGSTSEVTKRRKPFWKRIGSTKKDDPPKGIRGSAEVAEQDGTAAKASARVPLPSKGTASAPLSYNVEFEKESKQDEDFISPANHKSSAESLAAAIGKRFATEHGPDEVSHDDEQNDRSRPAGFGSSERGVVDGDNSAIIDANLNSNRKDATGTSGQGKQGSAQYLKTRSSKRNIRAKAFLSRSLGRNSLPHQLSRRWAVEVSPAEWDADEGKWKYRVLVQRRALQGTEEKGGNKSSTETVSRGNDTKPSSSGGVKSFTAAFTWRSLPDFVWLEKALRAEFHGALLLPLLTVAIGTPNVDTIEYEVDPNALRDWLGDVMNGVRGQGELVLDQDSVDLMGSEALEAFLYRNTNCHSLEVKGASASDKNRSRGHPKGTSTLDRPWRGSPEKEYKEASLVESLWMKPFACLPMDNLCAVGGEAVVDHDETNPTAPKTNNNGWSLRLPVDLIQTQSRAIGDADSLKIQDSFVEYSPEAMESNDLVIHSNAIEAKRALAVLFRKRCLGTMEQLQVLSREEAHIGAAWKRFAISLSNLFAYEKEVENSRVGEKKDRSKPSSLHIWRLEKDTVDELLRVLSRQKHDRSIPSLNVLESFLAALAGDLSAVGPAVDAHNEALAQLDRFDLSSNTTSRGVSSLTATNTKQSHAKGTSRQKRDSTDRGWSTVFKSSFFSKFFDVPKSSIDPIETVQTMSTSDADLELAEANKRAFEERLRKNEQQLQKSLGVLCQATPLRCARMCYKFLQAEVSQANLLSSAAISLRTKINVADKKLLTESDKKRRDESTADDKTEVAILQKILNINVGTKFSTAASSGEGVTTAAAHDRVIAMAQQRLGRWDADLALAIMEAVGIEDAEVQVEDTTRDLRLVRRHAIGLRENLARCLEAATALKVTVQNPSFGDDEFEIKAEVSCVCRCSM